MTLDSTLLAGPAIALLQVVFIDVALAGDNAVAVGMAAAGLTQDKRRKAIVLGLLIAMILRIGFAVAAVQLLTIIGLLLAGGVLLLWVCWKMWSELRDQDHEAHRAAEAALDDADGDVLFPPMRLGEKQKRKKGSRKAKTLGGALLQILVADLSMSLDNVLAVAGAAREHPIVLVFGLLLSVTMMGVAASWIAKLLHRWRWIGYAGCLIVFYVSLHMIWEGHRAVVVDLHRIDQYNAFMPDPLDISPKETEALRRT